MRGIKRPFENVGAEESTKNEPAEIEKREKRMWAPFTLYSQKKNVSKKKKEEKKNSQKKDENTKKRMHEKLCIPFPFPANVGCCVTSNRALAPLAP